jgi:hypothetical protein
MLARLDERVHPLRLLLRRRGKTGRQQDAGAAEQPPGPHSTI